jgi:ornithine decarboxylase
VPRGALEVAIFILTRDREVRQILEHVDEDEAFWVADMNRPRESLSLWDDHLPTVKRFYAMKCCDEPSLLSFLAARGIGFDCASEHEIMQILALGVDPSRIVFSHPIKSVSALRDAKEHHVDRLVFDTVAELKKIIRHHAGAEVFLRVN